MKRVLAIVLTAVLSAALLSACGSSSGAGNSGSAAPADAAAASSSATAESTAASEQSSANSGDVITLTFADFGASTTATAKGEEDLAAKIREATDGRINIEVFHDGSLGTQGDGLTMLDTGVCDIVWCATALFAGQFDYTEATQLPMMGIKDAVQCTDILWKLMEKYPEIYEEQFGDYHMLLSHVTPVNLIGTDKVVNSIDDLKGLNMRTSAGINSTIMAAWAANPTSTSPADLYTAMQKGTINGYIFNGTGIDMWNLAELTDGLVDVGLGYCPVNWLCTDETWDSIPAEDQEIITEILGYNGSIYCAELMEENTAEVLEDFVAKGGDYKQLSSGDELYDQLKEKIDASSAVDDWKAAVATDSFDPDELIAYMEELIAE